MIIALVTGWTAGLALVIAWIVKRGDQIGGRA